MTSTAYKKISMNKLLLNISRGMMITTSYLGVIAMIIIVLALAFKPVRTQALYIYDVVLFSLSDDYEQAYFTQKTDFDIQREDELNETNVEDGDLSFLQALTESIEDPKISGVSQNQELALRSYIARKYRIASSVAGAIIQTAFNVGREKDIDPQLILAVIAIESRYNPYAESHVGAQGLMQVMTKVHKEKFKEFGEGPLAAVHPLANIKVGTQILYDCIKRRGSIDGGLACYVGATGPSDGGYGNKVKAEWRRIALASGIAIQN